MKQKPGWQQISEIQFKENKMTTLIWTKADGGNFKLKFTQMKRNVKKSLPLSHNKKKKKILKQICLDILKHKHSKIKLLR